MRGQSTLQRERRGLASEIKMREGVMTDQERKTGGGRRDAGMRMVEMMRDQDTVEGRRGQGSATYGIKEMKESLGVWKETTGKGILGALAGTEVGEEVVAVAGVALTEEAEAGEVAEEGLTEVEADVEVLTEEEEGEGEVGGAGVGVVVGEAALVRTGLAHPVASVTGHETGSASSVKHPNQRLVTMPTLHPSGRSVVVNLAQGTQRNPL